MRTKNNNRKSFKFVDGTIYQRAESQYWQIYAPLLAGKMLRQSTGIRIEDDPSGEQARLFLANLRQSKSQLLKPTRKEEAYRKALNLIAQDNGYTPTRLSIKDAITKYTQTIKATAGTIRLYKEALSKFINYFGSNTLIDTIKSNQIEEYRNHLINQHSIETVKTSINIIRIFFNYLFKSELIEYNPFTTLSKISVKEQKKEKRIFTHEEIQTLLDYTKGTYWNQFIMLGYYTGQRISDIKNLDWNQINLENNTIKFHIQKTHKDLTVYIHPKLKDYLYSIPNKEGKVCKTDKQQSVLSMEFHRLLLKLNIIPNNQTGTINKRMKSPLSFHSLRRTLNSELASAGISPEIRSKIIGNSEAINIKHYTEIQSEAIKTAMNKLNI